MHRLLPVDKAVITKDPIYYEDLNNGIFYACQANGQVDMVKWDEYLNKKYSGNKELLMQYRHNVPVPPMFPPFDICTTVVDKSNEISEDRLYQIAQDETYHSNIINIINSAYYVIGITNDISKLVKVIKNVSHVKKVWRLWNSTTMFIMISVEDFIYASEFIEIMNSRDVSEILVDYNVVDITDKIIEYAKSE